MDKLVKYYYMFCQLRASACAGSHERDRMTPRADSGDSAPDGSSGPQRRRLADDIYGRVLEMIAAGQFVEGTRLPSENQLCREYSVSRPVVREAFARLRSDGIVVARQGAGSFVRRRPPQALIEHSGAGDVAAIMRCMEARLALEPAAARHAAYRASPADLELIARKLDQMEASMRARVPSREADLDVHRAIAGASGNDLFCDMLDVVRPIMLRAIDVAQTLTKMGDAQRVDTVVDEHRQILEAIRSRDGEAAELLMRYHLVQARRRVTE